jgi:hypothetical protein
MAEEINENLDVNQSDDQRIIELLNQAEILIREDLWGQCDGG